MNRKLTATLFAGLAALSCMAAETCAQSSHAFGRIDKVSPELLAREPRFEKAFAFLKRTDLAQLPVGRYTIAGDDIYAMVQECDLTDVADHPKSESHRKYIDIQAPLSGEEVYGYGLLTEENRKQPFDVEKDYALFTAQPVEWKHLKPGEFAVFFPPDGAHSPCCRAGGPARRVRKVVVKVRKSDGTR